VRWDGGIERGSAVPPFYDSLLGKLAVWAESRERAIKRMRRALDELVIAGVPTSREFHVRVMREREFCEGAIDTGYWDRVGRRLMAEAPDGGLLEQAALAAALLEHERRTKREAPSTAPAASPWVQAARRDAVRGAER
jgi:acetyl-CoA carboxylase biotin carboxylase subunit